MPGELTRAILVREARLQLEEGAHYLKKGFGQRFDMSGHLVDGGVPGREAAIGMITTRVTVPRMKSYVRFACWTDFDGRRVCGGRWKEYELSPPPIGDPDDPDHLRTPIQFAWNRPENMANSDNMVLGDCCVGRRHFDCYGFVNYCYWRALGTRFPGNPARFGARLWKSHNLPLINRLSNPVQAGDILFLDTRHMGMAVSPTQVAHAAGHWWGVQITDINKPIYPHLPQGLRWDQEVARPRILDSMP